MTDLVLFNGQWWEAIESTAPGQSPASHPEKWRIVRILRGWNQFLVQRAYADLLPGEGQAEKAGLEIRRADTILDRIAAEVARGKNNPADLRAKVVR